MNKKFKRALSSILAFIMVVSTLTVMNVSSVFAADTTTATLSRFSLSDTTTPAANYYGGSATASDYLFSVTPSTAYGTDSAWQNDKEGSYMTGLYVGDNPRYDYENNVSPSNTKAAIYGNAIKIHTTVSGSVSVVLEVGANKTAYVSKFDIGKTTGEYDYVDQYATTSKCSHTFTFDAASDYDYYVYVTSSKSPFGSVSFTPDEASTVVTYNGDTYVIFNVDVAEDELANYESFDIYYGENIVSEGNTTVYTGVDFNGDGTIDSDAGDVESEYVVAFKVANTKGEVETEESAYAAALTLVLNSAN